MYGLLMLPAEHRGSAIGIDDIDDDPRGKFEACVNRNARHHFYMPMMMRVFLPRKRGIVDEKIEVRIVEVRAHAPRDGTRKKRDTAYRLRRGGTEGR